MSLISFSAIADGSTGTASQVNTPLSTIYNDYNGNITDANIASGAAIAGSKIAYASVSNPYKFRVYRNSAWTMGAGNTLVQFDTKNYDTGSNVDIVTNKGRFTAPIAGFYQFNASVQSTVNSGTYIGTFIYKNGSSVSQGMLIDVSNTIGMSANVSDVIQLVANDYVEIYVVGTVSNAGGTGSIITYFSGFLVSAT